jgi:putative glutamine amidotransferase
LLPCIDDERALRRAYDLADGVLFCGGGDICPTLYRETPSSNLWVVDSSRDAIEFLLAKWAYQDGKPTLGICRGMQAMAVSLGGSLHQDIPSVFGTNHDCIRYGKVNGLEHLAHLINIKEESSLFNLLQCNSVRVNSNHHQAIKVLPSHLEAVAHAPDGVIEAIEAKDRSLFYCGVQSHPEVLWQEKETRWRDLFVELIRRAKGKESVQVGVIAA